MLESQKWRAGVQTYIQVLKSDVSGLLQLLSYVKFKVKAEIFSTGILSS